MNQPIPPLLSSEHKGVLTVATIDLEKVGCRLVNPIPMLGITVGKIDLSTLQGTVIEKTRFTLPFELDLNDEEVKRCLSEFWDKQDGLLDMARKTQLSTWKDVAAYVDELYTLHNVTKWVSDNPAFDLGHLDYQLTVHGARPYPVRHSPTGDYVSVEDCTEQVKGLTPKMRAEVKKMMDLFWSNPSRRKHCPEDDAEGIFYEYVYVLQARRLQNVIYS